MKAFSGGRLAAFLGLAMVLTVIASMVLTTLLPAGVTRSPDVPDQTNFLQDPTPGPVVFPTPDPNGPGLARAVLAVHPSGTFTIAQPQGFTPTHSASELVHSFSMVDTGRFSVIHAYLQAFAGPQDLNTLDIYNSQGTLAATWSSYDSWTETGREQAGGRLVIDFTLGLGENTYLAREITWPVAENPAIIYVIRFVVPDNNLALLGELELMIIPSYDAIPEALTVPLVWPGVASTTGGYALRYAPDWTLVEAASGSLTTLTTPDGGTLTLTTEDNVIASEDDARAWAEASRTDVSVLAVEPVERTLGEGYAVTYTFATADGEPQSGLSLLLNGPEDQTKIATLRLDQADVNLLDPQTRTAQAVLWQALDTFTPLPADAIRPGVTG